MRPLTSGAAEGVCLGVDRRIILLYAPVAARTDEFAVIVEDSGADRDSTLGETCTGFGDGSLEQECRVERHGVKDKS